MSALGTLALATGAFGGVDIVFVEPTPGTPLVGDSCAFGFNAIASFAFAAGEESTEAVPPVFTVKSRNRVGAARLRAWARRIGALKI